MLHRSAERRSCPARLQALAHPYRLLRVTARQCCLCATVTACLPLRVSSRLSLPVPQELTVLIKALARDGIHPESFCYMEVLVVFTLVL
jgi:hypothetical protein